VAGLYRAAQMGLGIAALPDYIIGDRKTLVQILRDLEMPQFNTYFVYPEEQRRSKRIEVFRDFIVSKAKEWSF
jgi:DNA-binding transcriptional LysR family regulator